MPHRLPTPCTQPGCKKLSLTPKCEPHTSAQERAYDVARGTAAARDYGPAWSRRRARFLAEHTSCSVVGCNEQPTDVDHIVSRRKGGSEDDDNLQALCHSHHSQKTAREDGRWRRRTTREATHV